MKTPLPLKKLQIIDLARSFSILAVLAFHGSNFTRPLAHPWAQAFFHLFQKNGTKGVFVFFVVSGFLISKIIDERRGLFRPDFKEFYVRRAARILPLLFLIVLVGAAAMELLPRDSTRAQFIFGTETDLFPGWLWLSIVFFAYNWLQMFLYPHYFTGSYWIVLWTLSVEEQFYFFYPFMLKKLGNTRGLVLFLAGVIAAAVGWRAFAYYHCYWTLFGRSANSLSVFDLIALGVLLYLAVKKYAASLSRQRGLCRLICLAGFLLTVLTYFFTESGSPFEEIFSWTLLGLGVALFLLGGLFLPFFESPWLWALGLPGRYCYGMYLYHFLVLFLIGSFLPALSGLWSFGLFSLATLALSAASYHWFELPANRLIRRFFDLAK